LIAAFLQMSQVNRRQCVGILNSLNNKNKKKISRNSATSQRKRATQQDAMIWPETWLGSARCVERRVSHHSLLYVDASTSGVYLVPLHTCSWPGGLREAVVPC